MRTNSGIAGYLIIFTDAKGSTKADEKSASKEILALRERLFHGQLKGLTAKNGWNIIKSVGDALVFSVKVPKSGKATELVKSCLEELFQAWKKLNSTTDQIRVAVHYAEATHIVSGKSLATKLKSLLKDSDLDSLNAFLGSLKSDIFGPGINRSARLAHAPSGSLFVLSLHVVEKLFGKKISAADIEDHLLSQTALHPTLPLRGPIPLVKVKGVDSIGFPHLFKKKKGDVPAEPWWIWELVDEGFSKFQSFGAENKRFQVIRMIQAIFPVKQSLQKRADGNSVAIAPDPVFKKHLKDTTALAFFSDLVLRVVDTWSCFRPSDNRNFGQGRAKGTWSSSITEDTTWLPYYVVFSSCPNEATDEIVRDALVGIKNKYRKLPNNKGLFKIEAISYQVHRWVRWAKSNVAGVGSMPDRRLYLIFFQVRNSAVEVGGDPDKLFYKLTSSIGDGFTWDIIAKGVVRGDKDGFLLASLQSGNPQKAEAELKIFLRRECQPGPGSTFWENIAPIKIVVCEPLAPIAKKHLDWLEECVELD